MEKAFKLQQLLQSSDNQEELGEFYRQMAKECISAVAHFPTNIEQLDIAELIAILPELELRWIEAIDDYFVLSNPEYLLKLENVEESRAKIAQRELGWIVNCAMQGMMEECRKLSPELWSILMLRCSALCFSFGEAYDSPFQGQRWKTFVESVSEVFAGYAKSGASREELESLLLSMQSPGVGIYATSWRIESRCSKGRYAKRSWWELLQASVIDKYMLNPEQYLPQSVGGEVGCSLFSERALEDLILWEIVIRIKQFYNRLSGELSTVVCRENNKLQQCFFSQFGQAIAPAEVYQFQQSELLDLSSRGATTQTGRLAYLRAAILQDETEALELAYDMERATAHLVEVGDRSQKLFWDKEKRKDFLQRCLLSNADSATRKQEVLERIQKRRSEYSALGGSLIELGRQSFLLEDSTFELYSDLSAQMIEASARKLVDDACESIINFAKIPQRLSNSLIDVERFCRIVKHDEQLAFNVSSREIADQCFNPIVDFLLNALDNAMKQFLELPVEQKFRVEIFLVEALLLQVVSQINTPSTLQLESGSSEVGFRVWLESELANLLMKRESRFSLALCLRKPSLLFRVEDFAELHAEGSGDSRLYLEFLARSLSTVWQEHYADGDLVSLYNCMRAYVKFPLLDAFSEHRFQINEFVDRKYYLTLSQSLAIPGALRKRLIEGFVIEMEEIFIGTEHHAGWFSQAFFFSLKQYCPLVWRKLLSKMLEDEYQLLVEEQKRFAQRRASGSKVCSVSEDERNWARRHEDLLVGGTLLLSESVGDLNELQG